MSLLKQISEDIKAYHATVESIVEQIEKFEAEIAEEKRLGILEASDYYTNGNQPSTGNGPGDTLAFQAPTEPVAKPVQHPNEGKLQRIHVIYDPSKGKVVNAIKTDPRARPPAQYVEANAQQVQDALKHIQTFSPDIADRLRQGRLSIWIPRAYAQTPGSDAMAAHTTPNTGGTQKVNMDPQRLAAAQAAANKMTTA